MMYFLNCIYLLSFLSTVLGLGLIIEPTLAGDFKKYSSINNVQNCVSYQTVKDDLILVRIKSGDKFVSQSLNLNIFDLDNNKIRVRDDISKELNFMFTNLNNPQGLTRNWQNCKS